jgi:diguanylate cyclase (GGDEF)-like protein
MTTASTADSPDDSGQPGSMSRLLRHIQRVETSLQSSARGLVSVNSVLNGAIGNLPLAPGIFDAIEEIQMLEKSVCEACILLSTVSKALEEENRTGIMLRHQFAAAVEQEQAARHASLHDVLTGLPNRMLFRDRLEHGIAQATRHNWHLAVMFVDLDKFKDINDAYGHEVGDRVLKTVAERLKESTRNDDTVCRLGGDEFGFLMLEIGDEKCTATVAEKIINVIQAPMKISIHGFTADVSVRASIGISVSPKDGTAADALVSRADFAMYRAKRSMAGYSFAE